MMHDTQKQKGKGSILIQVITFMAVGMIILSGLIGWGIMSSRVARISEERELALSIAEAGIGYYRWHLAHAPADFQDGTGAAGPYVHSFYDKNGIVLGTYSLDIVPPAVGSTLVTITSTGTLASGAAIHRTVRTRIGKPSIAKFSVLSNADISIGANIFGPMHSNGFIYLVSDVAHNLMTSAMTRGISPITGTNEWGVYSDPDPSPPTGLATVTPMFLAGRSIGVPAMDFAGITVDLNQMKAAAQTGGKYYAASGSGLGYHIVLHNDDTYTITTVTTLATGGGSCKAREWWNSCALVPNASWSIGTETAMPGGIGLNVPFPQNGIIFTEDNVWVDGSITTARLTIVAAKLPDGGSPKNIIVNNNLLYASKTGAEVLGLIAQNNFLIGVVSSSDLSIYAAIIAQQGRVSRYAYDSCGTFSQRGNLYLYGMFASNQRYAYGNLGCNSSSPGNSGYNTSRTYEYDPNLLFAPPPSFPLTTDQYQVLSWDEI
jgi:type II secretory pathway pseudopilin PulG